MAWKHYDDFLDRMPREEAAEIEQTVGRCPRAVRRATAIGSGPGSKPGTPDPRSGGAQQAEEAVGHWRLELVGKEQVGLGRRGCTLALWGRGLGIRQS